MKNRMTTRAIVVVSIAAVLAGCDTTTISTAPTTLPRAAPPPVMMPPPPPFRVADVRLSGYVFEMTMSGRAPIEGVGVANGEGEYDTTDATGFYSLGPLWVCPCPAQPWVAANTTFLWVEKAGYTSPPGIQPSIFRGAAGSTGARDVVIDGDTWFDIELVRK